MNSVIPILTALILAVVGCSIFLFVRFKKIRDLNREITAKYAKDLSEEKKQYKVMKERVDELEKNIQETFGVSIRQEITKVECIFNKVEMAFLMAGVFKLIGDKNSTIDDKEYYIKLYKKIQENIDHMEEPRDES